MPTPTIVQVLDFIPDSWRSMEQLLVSLASRMRAEGWRTVHVFTGEPTGRMRKVLDDLSSPYLVVSDPMTEADARRITPLLREMEPRLIQTHFWSMFNPLLRGIQKGSGAQRLVVTDHSSGLVSKKGLAKSLLSDLRVRYAASYIDQVIGVSEFVCRRDVDDLHFPRDKVTCVHNGVDVQRFSPSDGAREEGRPFTIGFIGYHIPAKGLGVLLQAAQKLRARERAMRLLIAGSGPGTEDFKREAADLGLADETHFLGQITDTPAFYRQLDVLVVPSEWEEAFGFVVAEAAACGVCVVSSDVGGIPEILGRAGEAGLTFPRGRVDALAQILSDLMNDPARGAAIGRRARERMVRSFSIDACVDGHAKVLLSLLR